MRAGKTEWTPASIATACCLTLLLSSDSRPWMSPLTGYGSDMVESAEAFLATLDDASRAKAVFPFDGEERFNWHFIPRARKGLPLKDMTGEQRSAAHALMQSALSSQGYLKATGIMQVEGILRTLENNSARRDPQNYYFSIFGGPVRDGLWGWRLEGHHLSLNFTSVMNELTVTPAFMGANPHRTIDGPFAGWRVLGAEEDLARTLLDMLSDAQRAKAIIADTAPRDVITGNDRRARLQGFEGLPASEMTEVQRDALLHLIIEYAHNMRSEIARAQMDKIARAGLDNLYFAWAGGVRRGEAHYYRVHGPTVLFEYDNTQANANHVHTVWRDFQDDFGEDLLRKHYEESDHHQ